MVTGSGDFAKHGNTNLDVLSISLVYFSLPVSKHCMPIKTGVQYTNENQMNCFFSLC